MNAITTPRLFPINFVDHLHTLAQQRPLDTALIIVTEECGAPVDTRISYAALERRVRALAAVLQARFGKGERALLLLDNDDHYVVGFLACLYAGVIAVPVFPPESARPQHIARLVGIGRDARASCVLTTAGFAPLVGKVAEDLAGVCIVAVDAVAEAEAANWQPHAPQPDDVAFLQYTSGSTAAPKGVMVTHGNLMANEKAIEEGLAMRADDVFVSWLPLYHDMGLIGGLLQPIHRGIPAVLMTPQFFLEKPVRWLEAISRHRGTVSGGPDFSYRLCLERIGEAQRRQLDLSQWRLAFSGAEPVRRDTLDEFIEGFAVAGLSPTAAFPCYGLAEATLFVTGAAAGAGMVAKSFSSQALAAGRALPTLENAEHSSELVACGAAATAHTVVIVDPLALTLCAADGIGEIWVSGPSVAAGYWERPDATAETFIERDGRRWLRTGDAGFLCEGQLYIAGRLKDLIIVRGHNIYPQDIEKAIEAEVDVVRKGRVAAFAVPGERGDGIGIAVELSRSMQKLIAPAQLVDLLSTVVSRQWGEPAAAVALLNPGALPKTSSGKLQRSACRQQWCDGTFDAYATFAEGHLVESGVNADVAKDGISATLDATEAALATLWREVLKLGDVRPLQQDANFFGCGGSSLTAVQLAGRIRERWQIEIAVRDLFDHPQLSAMARAVQRCVDSGKSDAAVAIARLPQEQRGGLFPLSHAQERLWFLWQLDPTSTAYHIGGTLQFEMAVSIDALRAALDQVIARHESLRTCFEIDAQGVAWQRLHSQSAEALTVVDLREMPVGEREALAGEVVRRVSTEPFDLTRGPLLRAALIRVSDDKNILLLVMHHIIADNASLQILLDEWASGYRAQVLEFNQGILPEPAIHYADYAVWQRQWLSAGEGARQLRWWQEQLGDEQPVLQLPTDRPRPARANYRAARQRFGLPAALLDQLRQRAHEEQVTLFMLLLTALQMLLYRYTGQHDIRVGVPVANRHHIETEDVIGFFVNTQVMRNVLSGRTRIAEALSQTRAMALGAQAHQDLPFEWLVAALQPQRSLSHTPLFQVMFNYLREDWRALEQAFGTGINIERIEHAAQFELTLEAHESADGGIELEWLYAAELFEPATITRMTEHYQCLLRALLDSPDALLADIDLLDGGERRQLAQWSENPTRYSDREPVHGLFERQVERQPDAVAVIFNDETLSYAELNRRANQLAHYLIKRGVGPEHKIGVAVERSVAMIVGLLAVLKAGAAYVPLDPDYPAERLAYMIVDSGIGLLLTQRSVAGQIPASLPIIDMDTLTLGDEAATNPNIPIHPDNIAYVIYTSGSTGKPKGAANRHCSLSNCMQWMQQTYQLGAGDTVLHKAPFGFDVSVWELFWPLTAGARLLIANPGDQRDPTRIVELIRQHGVTTLNFVPAMLQAFLDTADLSAKTSLKHIMCGGEAVPASLQRVTLQRLPGATLQNLYGPTEAAIHVTQWTCRVDADTQVPIGRPIAHTQARVLDADLNPVPQGIAGELYLGGISLARGYLNRSGLSAERFIADPFDQKGGRLYRTGDLVRWNREGQLDYLGRVDQQIKIRGFRIELGEIEAQLLAQPMVKEAVVIAQEHVGGTRLVAYLASAAAIDPINLRRELATVLPDYMVPAVIVVLAQLPLNANGKVDRAALPAPTFAREREYTAPRGEIESTLAAIWADVLGLAQVGRDDNFFDLGGHSLQLIRIRQAVAARLGAISIVDLFAYPTIAALAGRMAAAETNPLQGGETRAAQQRAARLRRRRQTEGV